MPHHSPGTFPSHSASPPPRIARPSPALERARCHRKIAASLPPPAPASPRSSSALPLLPPPLQVRRGRFADGRKIPLAPALHTAPWPDCRRSQDKPACVFALPLGAL